MCGLFGCAGHGIIQEDLKIMYELGLTAQVRGVDSSGVYEVNSRRKNPEDTERYFRTNTDFSYFSYDHMKSDDAKADPKWKIFNDVHQDIIMGHTRMATMGDITTDNAQPIIQDNFVIAVNGTMKNENYADPTGEISDSRFFLADMVSSGFKNVLMETTKDDQFAFVLYDKETRELHFARNIFRQLWFAINKKRRVMYWASEPGQLRWILARNSVEHEALFMLKDGVVWTTKTDRIKQNNLIFFEHGKFYDWEDNGKKWVFERDKPKLLPAPETTTMEGENILPFLKKNSKENSSDGNKKGGTDLSARCGLCDKKINVMGQYFIRNDPRVGYYNKTTGVYVCQCINSHKTSISHMH